MKIYWTPTSKTTYFNVLDYLEKNWSLKKIHNFINEVEHLLLQIAENPDLFMSTGIKKYIRKGYISRHLALYLQINEVEIQLFRLRFWDNRQDPEKLSL